MSETFPGEGYPLVSAVISTRGRPQLLPGAVRSALRQTWPMMEVIVVIDGPDPAAEVSLEAITDSRLRVIVLSEPSGGSEARNAGVRVARGNWVALLDDDDEWLPEKIERQMRAAHAMPDWFPVVSCRLIAQAPATSRVLPLKPYQAPQPIADYLFCRASLRDPGGVMQTSTLLTPRDLLLAVPFKSGLTMHQDWDWLIRVGSHKGVGFFMVPQPLSIWRVEDKRVTVSRDASWKTSLSWIRSVRELISPRAFSWFVAVQCAWRAQRSQAGVRSLFELLRVFLREGKPESRSFLNFLVFAFVPRTVRQLARKGLRRNRRAGGASGLSLVHSRKPVAPILRRSSS